MEMETLNDPRMQLLIIGGLIFLAHWVCFEDVFNKWVEGEWWGLLKQGLVLGVLAFLTWQGFIRPIRERRQPAPQRETSRDRSASSAPPSSARAVRKVDSVAD